MALAVQQSLFEAGGGAPMVESARWIEGLLFGELAVALCVLAVACIGGLMLVGRSPLREGVRVVIGCFVLLGAPVIATGFVQSGSRVAEAPTSPPPVSVEIETTRPNLPPANIDPYAGASLRQGWER